jgi:hypothetical protein
MKILLAGALFALFGNAAYGTETQCFPTVAAYMSKSYGESYQVDDNISVREKKYGRNILYSVADKTSGTNYARSLLRENTKGEFCLVLVTPPIAQLDPEMRGESEMPQKFIASDQAPPGLPGHEITYVFNPKDFRYDAKTCKEILRINKKKKSKLISCTKLTAQ